MPQPASTPLDKRFRARLRRSDSPDLRQRIGKEAGATVEIHLTDRLAR